MVSGMDLVRRVLEDSQLLADVRAVAPEVFSRIVAHIGVADSAELLALASPEQHQHVLDEVLWHSDQPGEEERFDVSAFVTWLEVLLENGDGYAVERLCGLSEDLVALGVGRVALVFEPEVLGIDMASAGWDDAARTEKALDGCLLLELADYTLVSRGVEGWDAVIHAMVAMDRDHHEHLLRILERCAAATQEHVEESGGVHAVLSAAEMLEADALGERITRLGRRGYVDSATAKAFLRGARLLGPDELAAAPPREFITTRYFRDLEPTTASPEHRKPSPALRALLGKAGIAERSPLRLGAPSSSSPFRAAMAALADRGDPLYAQRMAELLFVVNVVVEGESRPEGGRHGLAGAAQRAIELCDHGLRHAAEVTGDDLDALLRRLGTEQLLRLGIAREVTGTRGGGRSPDPSGSRRVRPRR